MNNENNKNNKNNENNENNKNNKNNKNNENNENNKNNKNNENNENNKNTKRDGFPAATSRSFARFVGPFPGESTRATLSACAPARGEGALLSV